MQLGTSDLHGIHSAPRWGAFELEGDCPGDFNGIHTIISNTGKSSSVTSILLFPTSRYILLLQKRCVEIPKLDIGSLFLLIMVDIIALLSQNGNDAKFGENLNLIQVFPALHLTPLASLPILLMFMPRAETEIDRLTSSITLL